MHLHARPLGAYPVYLGTCAASELCFTMVFTVNLLYQAAIVGLDPFEMILVGTALEGSYFVANVPFGVAADAFSRRVAVAGGFAVSGGAFLLEGAIPHFWAIVAGALASGLGAAMSDGAFEAWAADELAGRDMSGVFLRGGQVGALGTLAGIAASVLLGLVDLRLAVGAGGAGLVLLALVLAFVMPERRRAGPVGAREGAATFRAGVELLRRSAPLAALMGAVGVAGAFSEGFDRLSTPHLLALGLPAAGGLDAVVWFGLLSAVGALVGIALSEVLRRLTEGERRRSLALCSVWAGTMLTVAAFALAPGFVPAAVALLAAGPLRALAAPLWMAWVSDRSDAAVRATVLSFAGQADCLGQVTFGPAVGLLATAVSVPAALLVSAALLVPALVLVVVARDGGALTSEGAPA